MRVRTLLMNSMLMLAACARVSDAQDPAPSNPGNSVVFFIGDGMGPAQVTAARIYKDGASGKGLTLDSMEQVALQRTWAANGTVTDSAAAGTALATGVKTNILYIGVDPGGAPIESMMTKAKHKGMSVGVISTARITHATPAVFYAHTTSRIAENSIASQLLASPDWDLAWGGGREFLLPKEEIDGESGQKGARGDGRNLINEAEAKGIRVLQTQKDFDDYAAEVAAGEKDPGRSLGVFNYDHMDYELERPEDKWGEPSLAELTQLAIQILSRNPKGYFLMVEGGRIDHACHEGKAKLAIVDTIAMDDAVAKALASVGPDGRKPLVVVTADHETGGLAINGYEPLDIKGDALLTDTHAVGGEILTFASGPGARRPSQEIDRADPLYEQHALNYDSSAAHTGVDVAVYSQGPGSAKFHGVMDNTEVAKRIMEVLGVDPSRVEAPVEP